MMKSLLLVGAIALAAPALAQSTATETANSPNDDVGAVSGNTVNAQNTTDSPTQMPLRSDGDEVEPATMSRATATKRSNAGVGGPYEAREYPPCSRTVTDNCRQTRNSPRPRG